MPETKEVIVRIRRQNGPKASGCWEEFALRWRPSMNVIICLRDIAEKPVTRNGKTTTPISYDSNCLEEVCGSCAMLINGKARMACSALVDQLDQPIRVEPLSKFPVVRDLTVDRQFMFESLKRVKAWIPIDGTYDLGEGRFRGAFLAAIVWKSAHKSTNTATSSGLRSLAKSASSTCTPPAPCTQKNAFGV
jgi:succinate dehydrogenase / fumarate reductase iron-sulfur subunit